MPSCCQLLLLAAHDWRSVLAPWEAGKLSSLARKGVQGVQGVQGVRALARRNLGSWVLAGGP
ncbi:hypothetical protein PG987_001180 [Apiospora arundinis]